MKYLGLVKTELINENENYKKLFDPLVESEFNDLRKSIKASGIINPLILEKNGDVYVLLSGHHRKAIAGEIGIEELPCLLVETHKEKVESLFDNANRRQLTEEKRKEMIGRKEAMLVKVYEDCLIPELYELSKRRGLSDPLLDELILMSPSTQKEILASLSTEVRIVPKEVLERHADEKTQLVKEHEKHMNAAISKYEGIVDALNKDLEKARRQMQTLADSKKIAEESLAENNREVADLKAKVKEKLDELEEKKETITVEVRREYETQITTFIKERETREMAVRTKQKEISSLNDTISSLKTVVEGLESKSKFWELECHRLAEQYNNAINYYSNPALVEVQLQVISELIAALVRFAKSHKWDEDTHKMSEKYRKDLDEQMRQLSKEIAINQKEPMEVEVAAGNVAKALGGGKPQLKSVKKAIGSKT